MNHTCPRHHLVTTTIGLWLALAAEGCAFPCIDDGLQQDRCPGREPEAGSGSPVDPPLDGGGFIDPAGDTGGGDDGIGDSAGAGDPVGADDSTGTDDSPGPPDGSETGVPVDEDADGISDDQDNCPGMANPGQDDEDADGLGDACDLDVPCGPGLEYIPLLAPDAQVSAGSDELCLGCTVEDPDLVIDPNLATFARMEFPVAAVGGAHVHVMDAVVHPAGVAAGFVVRVPDSLLTEELLSTLTLTTTLAGQDQHSVTADELVELDELLEQSDAALLVIPTSADYDGVRLDVDPLLEALHELDVFAACVQAPPR